MANRGGKSAQLKQLAYRQRWAGVRIRYSLLPTGDRALSTRLKRQPMGFVS